MDKGTSLNTKCGVVILNYNSHDLTVALAKKVSAYECVDYICVVDNCSKDSFDGDFQEAKIHYIKSKKNDGYSAGNNIGLRYLVDEKKCDRVFIANPDVLFDERTIWEMSRTFDKKDDLVILSTKRYGHDKATIDVYKRQAVDIVSEKVEMINNHKSPIQDDYIEKYLAEKKLDLTATLDAKIAYSLSLIHI